MPRKSDASPKAEREQLRDRMRALGASVPQIAADMARRFNLCHRPATTLRQDELLNEWCQFLIEVDIERYSKPHVIEKKNKPRPAS